MKFDDEKGGGVKFEGKGAVCLKEMRSILDPL
jgi:hypothetical protein